MRILKFEGAGWSEAESNGVGNCRIRTTFLNDKGRKIYLEMGGTKTHSASMKAYRSFDFPWRIDHCFYEDCNEDSDIRRKYEKTQFIQEYTKANILSFVNECLGCSFDAMEVINDFQWNGFSVDGEL